MSTRGSSERGGRGGARGGASTRGGGRGGRGGRGGGRGGKNETGERPKPWEVPESELLPEEREAKKQTDKIRAQVDDLFNKVKTLNTSLDAQHKVREGLNQKKIAAKNDLKQFKDKRIAIVGKKKEALDGIKTRQSQLKAMKEDIEKIREKLPFKNDRDENFVSENLRKIDQDIDKLEKQLKEGRLSNYEEKRVVGEVNALSKIQAVLRNAEPRLREINDQNAGLSGLREEVNSSNGALEKLSDEEEQYLKKLAAATDEIEAINAKIEGMYEKKRKFLAEVQTLKAKEKEINDSVLVYREKRKAMQREKQQAEWEARKAERAKQDELRKKQYEEREAERKRRDEERQYADLLKVPYEEDLALCDNLISYLTDLIPKEKPAEPEEKKEPAKKLEGKEGETVYVKKDTEEEAPGPAKKGKGKGKAKQQKTVTHKWEIFCSFEHLSLVPPNEVSELSKTLDAVKAKKEQFQKRSDEKAKENAATLEKLKAKAAEDAAKAAEEGAKATEAEKTEDTPKEESSEKKETEGEKKEEATE